MVGTFDSERASERCVFINVYIACVYVCVLSVCGEGERADFIGSCLQHNSEEGDYSVASKLVHTSP